MDHLLAGAVGPVDRGIGNLGLHGIGRGFMQGNCKRDHAAGFVW